MTRLTCVVTAAVVAAVSFSTWGESCIVKGSTDREPSSFACHDAYVGVAAKSFCSVLSAAIKFTTRPSQGVVIIVR